MQLKKKKVNDICYMYQTFRNVSNSVLLLTSSYPGCIFYKKIGGFDDFKLNKTVIFVFLTTHFNCNNSLKNHSICFA